MTVKAADGGGVYHFGDLIGTFVLPIKLLGGASGLDIACIQVNFIPNPKNRSRDPRGVGVVFMFGLR